MGRGEDTHTETYTHTQISACIAGEIQIQSVDCTDVNSWFLSLIMVVLDGNFGGGAVLGVKCMDFPGHFFAISCESMIISK